MIAPLNGAYIRLDLSTGGSRARSPPPPLGGAAAPRDLSRHCGGIRGRAETLRGSSLTARRAPFVGSARRSPPSEADGNGFIVQV